MVVGVGIDLLDVARMERELAREGGGVRDSVFTPREVAECEAQPSPARHYAGRFAAKEALLKALGGAPDTGAFREVEVERGEGGAPRLRLAGGVAETAARLGVRRLLVSISQTDGVAAAHVVLES